MNTTAANIHRCLEIKTPNNLQAYVQLKEIVLSNLETKYNAVLPEIVKKRIQEELELAAHFGYAPIYLLHGEIIKSIEDCDFPFYLIGANGSSLIDHALGITKINPLPPHYRCDNCKYTEFVSEDQFDTGFLLPKKICPICGEKLLGDGQNLQVESFLGYRRDRYPSLALGVPSSRLEDASTHIEKTFHAKQKDIHGIDFQNENGYLFILVDVVPVDKMFAIKKNYSFSEMNDPAVFEYLSKPEAYDCYLPYDPDIPTVKELLGCVEINHFYDLFKICGLVHNAEWLQYILPSIKNGSVNYRKTIIIREDIYHYLLRHNIDSEMAFKVTEMTRKGRASKIFENESLFQMLLKYGVSEDYLKNLKKIRYIMTSAQALEIASMVYRNAWLRLYG